jgi:hypothetical protein
MKKLLAALLLSAVCITPSLAQDYNWHHGPGPYYHRVHEARERARREHEARQQARLEREARERAEHEAREMAHRERMAKIRSEREKMQLLHSLSSLF